MRCVFLDFDGVLNSHTYLKSISRRSILGDSVMIDPANIARLNRLCSDGATEVVIPSSWRYGRSHVALHELLLSRGFTGVVRDKLPDWKVEETRRGNLVAVAQERGDEIQDWLDENAERLEVTAFVVLDDIGDMAAVRDHFVQTSFETGLTDVDVTRALEILNRPYKSARMRRARH